MTMAGANRVAEDRPLAGINVVDVVHGPLAAISRYLAELGARVDRIDSATAPQDRFEDAAANVGKVRHQITVDSSEAGVLMARAHVIIADRRQPIDLVAMSKERPAVVTMAVSDFGSDTSLSGWHATEPVLHALSGELARSGIRGRAPLLPPGNLAYQCSAAQAAYAVVVALYRAMRTGEGDHIDFSALDGAVQSLDPGFGISGSATLGKPANLLSRDRPAHGFQYPILRCADGHVRICLLAKRQWQGMFRWMGEPAQFASPEFNRTAFRYKSPELLPAIAAFFAKRTRAELEAEGQANGVPISAILTFDECIETDHVRARNAVCEATLDDGKTIRLPNGAVTIDGLRMGLAAPAQSAASGTGGAPEEGIVRPFEGLKVLDLGVIVVGAEQARLLGDQGADVVKVESRAYPDGNRQSYLSYGMSVSFAAGHRNKRSLSINLRDPDGQKLFLQLAAKADVILSNFKPGTLQSLGLDYANVSQVNPRIVMTDSSAFGAVGPWSGRMGYGPLVRAATGLTLVWRYPNDPEGFSDSITIYPDHVAARVGAMATVALLIRRLRTGRGGTASIAQSEVMLSHFAADVARVSAGVKTGQAPDFPWNVYRAAGDDEWCVVTVRDDDDWAALCDAIGYGEGRDLIGRAARLAARDTIDRVLGKWIAARSPIDVAETLQNFGVPCAPMLRLGDLPRFTYYRERGFYRVEAHPYLQERVIAERWHAKGRLTLEALEAPAPLAGEHTTEILQDWLGVDEAQMSDYLARSVIEPVDPAELEAVAAERLKVPPAGAA